MFLSLFVLARGTLKFLFLLKLDLTPSHSFRAPRKMSRSPRLAHKAPVMQAGVFFMRKYMTVLPAKKRGPNNKVKWPYYQGVRQGSTVLVIYRFVPSVLVCWQTGAYRSKISGKLITINCLRKHEYKVVGPRNNRNQITPQVAQARRASAWLRKGSN